MKKWWFRIKGSWKHGLLSFCLGEVLMILLFPFTRNKQKIESAKKVLEQIEMQVQYEECPCICIDKNYKLVNIFNNERRQNNE